MARLPRARGRATQGDDVRAFLLESSQVVMYNHGMLDDSLLQSAFAEVRRLRADYAEARMQESLTERIDVRDSAIERMATEHDEGWGIHVFAGGGWGFSSTSDTTPDAARSTARRAVETARAAGALRKSRSDVSVMPIWTGVYESPVERNPFEIPVTERAGLLIEATDLIRAGSDRVKVSNASLSSRRTDKLYMNTTGARLSQAITEVGAWIGAMALDDTGYSYRRSFGDLGQGGWEYIEGLDLRSNASRVGREAGELVVAPWAPSGPHTVVLGSDMVALLVHESCGHPTELDRVLGWETAFAGASFLMPDMLGTFRYGSPLVNMTADSLLPRGMGTFGWDDEGTPAQRSAIVREGIFTGYLMNRESAAAIGQRSNGCGRATSWGRIPLVRMVNVSLEPGAGSLDDLIGAVDDGLYLETPSSWSLDDKRMNFHFSTEYCREITGGKLGELRKGASFQGRTPQFWGSVGGVAGPLEWRLWGLPHCAKGEPIQLCPVSHGASPILVDELNLSSRHE